MSANGFENVEMSHCFSQGPPYLLHYLCKNMRFYLGGGALFEVSTVRLRTPARDERERL